jgi:actin-like ATPase involved in cell morphogenesis
MSISVGIDFGTSTTLIAIRKDDFLPDVISIGENTSWLPSVVGLADNGDVLIGEPAELTEKPFRSVKSSITNEDDAKAKPFGASPKELIGLVLREAMNRAAAVRSDILEATEYFVGCPAGWDGSQRRTIADIASALGIDVDIAEVIDEPVAAGLSWVESKWFTGESKPIGRALVFDAGGGTLDVAVMNIEESDKGSNRIVVLSAGSLAESGDAVDLAIARHIADANGMPEHDCENDVSLLKDARDVKEALATSGSVTKKDILIGTKRCVITIDQGTIATIVQGQLERSLRLVEVQLRLSELRGPDAVKPFELGRLDLGKLCNKIDNVVLVGGLTKLPLFGEALRAMFPKAITHEVGNPQELVALGLTFGERLQSLNLPRPPVNIVIESDGERETLYQAFTPLYKTINPMYDNLSLRKVFPGFVERGVPLLICQSPTRDHRRLQMVIAVKHDKGTNAPSWWTQYDGSDWVTIPKDELPSSLDFIAEMDARSGNILYDEHNFVDRVSWFHGIGSSEEFETTLFVGTSIFLKGADSTGFLVMDVDGTLLMNTKSGSSPGQHQLKMKILYWPLKSEELEVGASKGRFVADPKPTLPIDLPPMEDDSLLLVQDDEEEIVLAPDVKIGKDDVIERPSPVLELDLSDDRGCAEEFKKELQRVEGLHQEDARSGFLAIGHVSIATIMHDYDMTDQDIIDEINEVALNVSPEIFFVTEDDVPKVVLFRLIDGEVSKHDQRIQLTEMTYQMNLLRQRTTMRGLSDPVARNRYADIKRVKKLDPEFHFHLLTVDTSPNELIDVDAMEFDGVRSGLDVVAVHSLVTILNLYCAEESPRESTAIFNIDADKQFTFEGTSGNRLVQVLLPAEEYVKGTYPIGVDLFRLNPRLFLSKAAGPNKGMKATLESSESEQFHLLNNGITGVCESLHVEQTGGNVKVTATNLQIVNGCQTTETIWAWARKAADRSKVMVPLRLVQAGDNEALSRRISMTTNSQSAIAAADLVANDDIQKRAKAALAAFNVFYESRRGEWRKLSVTERNRLKEHDFDWSSDEILKINLRELGQALLSVTGRPNQAKEQIAGLFKEQNRGTYREVFGESWEDDSQITYIALLYIFLRDTSNWVSPAASKEYKTLAGLGRFYVMYLIYEFWRKGDDAFIGTASERAEDQELLVDGDNSEEWIEDFDPLEIKQLANLAIKSLDWVLKTSNGTIDGNRALLRQGAHKKAIEDRFRTLLDAMG